MHNPCLSGGTLGDLPGAGAARRRWCTCSAKRRSPARSASVAAALGYEAVGRTDADDLGRADAVVVVASHGRDEEEVLIAAARAPACPTSGWWRAASGAAVVVGSLDLADDERGADPHPGGPRHRRAHAARRSRCRSSPRSSPSDRARPAAGDRAAPAGRPPSAAREPTVPSGDRHRPGLRHDGRRSSTTSLHLTHDGDARTGSAAPAAGGRSPPTRARTAVVTPPCRPRSRTPASLTRRLDAGRLPRRRRPGHRAVLRRAAAAADAAGGRGRASARPRRPRRSPRLLDTPLIRLQCYEGIDAAEALYEWNYPRQLLASGWRRPRGRRVAEEPTCSAPSTCIAPAAARRDRAPRAATGRAADRRGRPGRRRVRGVPLRAAGRGGRDHPRARARCRAAHPPVVVLTSNRTRDLHDALQAALPLPLDRLPDARAGGRDRPPPGARAQRTTLAEQVAGAVQRLRSAGPAEAARRRRGDRLGRRARRCWA